MRFSLVYAGHAIKPLKKLAFHRRRLQSWTGSRPSGKPKDPCPHSSKATGSLPFEQSMRNVLKGMISYRIGFSECEHRRASNGQHARNGLFNESFPACQGVFAWRHLL